ncbi:IS200/IS605 family accessory protein TnpB-related protein [Saccharolobus solfataricus]
MKLGKYFAEHYDTVVMEDINVKKLVGKSLKVMRRRLHDIGFYEFRTILEYQLIKYGKKFTLVDPAYTSMTCARCGYVREDLTGVFSCSHLIRYHIVKLYQVLSNILYSLQVSLI